LAVRFRARATLHTPRRRLPDQGDAAEAGLPNVHPHTLRHSCGYYLAANTASIPKNARVRAKSALNRSILARG
jgi:hypothetical protein